MAGTLKTCRDFLHFALVDFRETWNDLAKLMARIHTHVSGCGPSCAWIQPHSYRRMLRRALTGEDFVHHAFGKRFRFARPHCGLANGVEVFAHILGEFLR